MLKTCAKGHQFNKSSDCPSCPICEKLKIRNSGWMAVLPSPARRALEANNIITIKQLAACTEKKLLQWHGIGKAGIKIMTEILSNEGLTFKK